MNNKIIMLLEERYVTNKVACDLFSENTELIIKIIENHTTRKEAENKVSEIEQEIKMLDIVNFCNTGKFDLPENFI